VTYYRETASAPRELPSVEERLAFANGEVEQGIERLFGMIQDVSNRPALAVLKMIVTGCVQFEHSVLQFG
jgi:hypothetical protein